MKLIDLVLVIEKKGKKFLGLPLFEVLVVSFFWSCEIGQKNTHTHYYYYYYYHSYKELSQNLNQVVVVVVWVVNKNPQRSINRLKVWPDI